MIASSKSFVNRGTIPVKHTGFGQDISPELTILDAPRETVTFAVILDDLDVPFCNRFNHWLIWNIPKTDTIPEGLPKGATIREPFSACQGVAWGKHGYRGPKPPFFIRNTHRYVFHVCALDCVLDIPTDTDRKRLLAAMAGHILSEAELVGTYGRGR